MAERFTEMQMLKLVEIYQGYPCLWNVTNELYKNRQARESAYKEIWEKLNIPGLTIKDVPKKIKNMRSSYYQEIKKIEKSTKSSSGEDFVYQPKVSWFTKADGFLRIVRNYQEIFWNIHENSSTTSDNSEIQNYECSLNDEISNSEAGYLNNPDENNDAFCSCSQQNEELSEFTAPLAKTFKKTKKQKDEDISIAIERIDRIAKTLTNATNSLINHKDDEFDVFGKYIAMSLRSLPVELGIFAKTDIQKALSDIQIKALRQNTEIPFLCGASTSYDPHEESPQMPANEGHSESIIMPKETKYTVN